MRPDLFVHPEADAEVAAQADYYVDAGTPDTAYRWVDRVREAYNRAADFPHTGVAIDDPRPSLAGWRLMTVRGFSAFAVAYRPRNGGGAEVFHVIPLKSDFRRRL